MSYVSWQQHTLSLMIDHVAVHLQNAIAAAAAASSGDSSSASSAASKSQQAAKQAQSAASSGSGTAFSKAKFLVR